MTGIKDYKIYCILRTRTETKVYASEGRIFCFYEEIDEVKKNIYSRRMVAKRLPYSRNMYEFVERPEEHA